MELVKIELNPSDRLKLYNQIITRMQQFGINTASWNELELGFPLPAEWPVDENTQPTLAELVVVSQKLSMRIIISNLELVPFTERT